MKILKLKIIDLFTLKRNLLTNEGCSEIKMQHKINAKRPVNETKL
jgi:hypothetical protein